MTVGVRMASSASCFSVSMIRRTYFRNDDGGCEDGQLRVMLQREHDGARGDPLPRLLSAI
jgi:hypothetical protein